MTRHWRTDEGDLVGDGHPDALILAYGDDDPLEADETVRDDAFDYIPDPDDVPEGLTAAGDEPQGEDGAEPGDETPDGDGDEPQGESAVDDVLDSLVDDDAAPAAEPVDETPAPKKAAAPRNKARRPTRNK